MKQLCVLIVLTCVPLPLAGNSAAYPKENVAGFVVEKLDVTTFPPDIQPKPEKGKKTFGDYGYMTRKVDEKEVLVEAPHGGSQIAIRVLEQTASGIYVCVDAQGENTRSGHIQRMHLLRRKDANELLKSRESWKEFGGCPAIGGGDNNEDSQNWMH
jgi:hypothetical protein